MASHFEAGPSALLRVMICRASVQASRGLPDDESAAAAIGTRRHRLLEICAKAHMRPEDFPTDGEWAEFTAEDRDAVNAVLDYLRDILDEYPGDLHVEVAVDLGRYWPGMKGTADLVVVSDRVVIVIDAKFGRIKVPATSPQLKAYAVGVLDLYDVFDFDHVIAAIAQPQGDNYDEARYTPAELYSWAECEMVPALAEAFGPEPRYTPHADACKFCRARAICEPRKAAHYDDVAYMLDMAPPEAKHLTRDEVAAILRGADAYDAYIADVRQYAEVELTAGRPIAGFKLVAGRATRRYIDNGPAIAGLAAALRAARPELSEADALAAVSRYSPVTLAAAEKLLGKAHGVFSTITTKPPGKATLAPESDPRPAIHPAAAISESLDSVEI